MKSKLLKGLVKSKISGRPVLLSHLITKKCNLTCGYCLWKDNRAGNMTTQEILDLHKNADKEGFVGCFLWGGEPLLRPDIVEILEHDYKLGWWVNLATNGTFLEKQAEIVGKYVDELLVSVDIPSEEHDSIRGKAGTFAACKKGIEAVKMHNSKCSIRVCCVISKHNKNHLKSIAEFAKEMGCGVIFQHIDQNLARNPRIQESDISDEERKKVCKELIDLKKQGYPLFNSYTYLRQFLGAHKYKCRSQRLYFTVWADGGVSSCATGKDIGNVLKTPMGDLLDSGSYDQCLKISDKCSKCKDSGTWETTHLYQLKAEALVNFTKQMI